MSRRSRTIRGSGLNPISSGIPTDASLKMQSIDKDIVNFLATPSNDLIDIEESYYQVIQPTSNNLTSTTLSYHVNGDTESLISLSESFFAVSFTTTNVGAGSDYAVIPYGLSFWLQNIVTRINQTDVSDTHNTGSAIGFMQFLKSCLTKPRTGTTSYTSVPGQLITFNPGQAGGGAPASVFSYAEPCSEEQDDDASTMLEYLPNPMGNPDFYGVDYGQTSVPNIANLNVNGGTLSLTYLWSKSYTNGSLIAAGPPAVTTPVLCPNAGAYNVNPNGSFEVKLKPRDSIWTVKGFLPSNLQMDFVLTVSSAAQWQNWFISAVGNSPVVTLASCNLYLKRVRPSSQSMTQINASMVERPLSIPLPNYSRVETYDVPTGTTLSTITCLQGVIPNAFVAYLVPTFRYNRTQANSLPYLGGRSGNYNGPGQPQFPPAAAYNSISQAWAIVGSTKYPRNASYFTTSTPGTNTGPLTSLQYTYDQYRLACVDSKHPYLNFTQWLNHFPILVFNVSKTDKIPGLEETDITQMGAVQLNLQYNLQTTYDQTLIVMSLSTARISIDAARNVVRDGF